MVQKVENCFTFLLSGLVHVLYLFSSFEVLTLLTFLQKMPSKLKHISDSEASVLELWEV